MNIMAKKIGVATATVLAMSGLSFLAPSPFNRILAFEAGIITGVMFMVWSESRERR